MKLFNVTRLRVLGILVLFMGLVIMSCQDSPTSNVEEAELEENVQSSDLALVQGTSHSSTANVFVSDGTELSWGPIKYTGTDWQSACKETPEVGLNAFTGPGSQTYAFPQFTASFAKWFTDASLNANWINAWDNISSSGHGLVPVFDKHWTKYSKTVSGDAGNYVMQYVADNCSWIFVNGTQTAHQTTNILSEVAIQLPGGDAELSFIILDGGGEAGGIYRLETFSSYKERTGVDPEVKFEGDIPVVIPSSDEIAPVITFNQEVNSLWPPNHKMVLVASEIKATDDVDGVVDVSVTVTSNEDANGKGDGNTDSDYDIVSNPDGSYDVYVRAERNGKKSGRTYTINMSSSDAAGNVSTDLFEVSVDKSQGRTK